MSYWRERRQRPSSNQRIPRGGIAANPISKHRVYELSGHSRNATDRGHYGAKNQSRGAYGKCQLVAVGDRSRNYDVS